MKKSEIVNIGKQLSKEYFRLYLEAIQGDFGILEDRVDIIGFFEDEVESCYRMMFRLPKLKNVYCEIIHDINTKRLHSSIFKKIDIERCEL